MEGITNNSTIVSSFALNVKHSCYLTSPHTELSLVITFQHKQMPLEVRSDIALSDCNKPRASDVL